MTKTLTTLCALACFIGTAEATVVFTEDFESYSNGDELTAESSWSRSASDKHYTVQNSTFSYGTVNFGNNSLRVTADTNDNDTLSISFTAQTGHDVYLAYYGFTPEFKTNSFYYSNLHTSVNSTDRNGVNGSDGDITAGIDGTSGTSTANLIPGSDVSFVTLVRYNWDAVNSAYTSVDVWVKTDGTLVNTATDPIRASATNPTSSLTSLSTVSLGLSRMNLNAEGDRFFDLDSLRVATTAQEALTGIPEPASVILMGLGGLLLLSRGRKAAC